MTLGYRTRTIIRAWLSSVSDMFSILDVVAEPDDYIEHQMSSKIESENADDWYWSAAYANGLSLVSSSLMVNSLSPRRSTREMCPALSNATSTGSRVFGAMKGALHSNIFIPHSEKRFPGYDPEAKTLDAEVLKKYIFSGHVAEYMESLEEEDDERFKKQFAMYLADGVGSEDMEEIYTNAYAAICEDPTFKADGECVENIQTKFKTFQAGRSAEAEIDEDEEE
ncbi:ribosomal L18 C-terminal region-domain-containing protein [Phellopilus nigrolimitatus]|nr:ribosomal L18 C-terminal region-domain-containing protein [Phellopilus nigrolimitatus]